MEKILILAASIIVIGLIVWWFFGKPTHKETEAHISEDATPTQNIEVTVSGGYTPNTVVLKQSIPATITFNRKDPSGCFSHVVFPDFGINEELPIDQQHSITIDTSRPGEYQYACGMNMFHGKIVIK